jgi:hypothetical protein
VTRHRRPGFTRSRRCGAAAVAASFGRKPYGAAAAAHGTPVTGRLRSPPYPAAAPASTTARAVTLAPGAPTTARMSQRTGRNAAHYLGWPLQPQRCSASRWRGTRLRRAVDPGDLGQPSGPDGEGQARGQARNAHGEPPIGRAWRKHYVELHALSEA